MESSAAQPKRGKVFVLTVLATIALVLAPNFVGLNPLAWMRRQLPEGVSPLQAYFYALAYPIAFILGLRASILFHEVGHAIAGHARGFKFCYLMAGRLWIDRPHGSLRFRRQRQLVFGGGFCLSSPGPDATRNDLLWFIAGGPMASAALACIGVGVAWFMGPQSDYLGFGTRLVLAMTGGVSALLFATSMFSPAPSSGVIQDGARMRILWYDEVAVSSELAGIRLGGLSALGVRPRDWPRQTIDQLDASGADRLRWVRMSAEIAASVDRGELVQALAQSEAMMREADSMSPIELKVYALMHSLLVAHVGGDSVQARKWFEKSRGCLIQQHEVLTAEAAVQRAEGKFEQARGTLERARAAWEEAIFPVTDFHRELVATVESGRR